mgnify:FL=1
MERMGHMKNCRRGLRVNGSKSWGVAALVVLAGSASAPAIVQEASPRRGLARFFDTSVPLMCAGKAAGVPMCIRSRAADEPDGEPFRGMMLEPMFDEQGRPRLMACYSADNPPSNEMMNILETVVHGADRFQIGASWPGSDGLPVALTWSFVPDGLSIPNGIGEGTAPSTLFATLDAEFASLGGRTTWINLFQQCFDRWELLTGVTYTRVSAAGVDWDNGAGWGTAGNDTTLGDIRISMKPIDGQNGVLAYNNFPTNGDMVMDSGEDWGGQTTNNEANNFRFMRNVIMHEHGHGLGFEHVCPTNNTKLMEPFLSTSFDGPRHDDIRAAHRNYGDAFGNNSTIAGAFDLGTLSNSTNYAPTAITGGTVSNSSKASIDSSAEQDYYKVTTTQPLLCTITVTPLGLTYADHPQDANCNDTTTNTNSLQGADLAFDVVNSIGSVQLAVNNNAIGSNEQFSGFLLSPPGALYVRVKRNSAVAFNDVQLYALTINTTTSPAVTASDGSSAAQVALSWSGISGATAFNVFRNTVDNRSTATSIASNLPGNQFSFNDTTADPGTNYFYWVEVVQGGPSKPLNIAGEPGFRQASAGACCTGTSCSVVTESACTGAGGSFRGASSPCADTPGNPVTCCPANFDQVGGVSVSDLFGFLDAWFAQFGSAPGSPSADWDSSGLVDVGDLFGFLDAWFLGCP